MHLGCHLYHTLKQTTIFGIGGISAVTESLQSCKYNKLAVALPCGGHLPNHMRIT